MGDPSPRGARWFVYRWRRRHRPRQVGAAPDHITMAVMAALMAAAFVFAVIHWMRSGRPVVMLLFVAGGCMMVMEPLVDTVAGCWFAANSTIAFIGWGRPIPVWVCLTYFAYFGIGGAIIWIAMRRGLTRTQVWYFYLGEVAADFILESALLRTGLYTYYGNQPLAIGGFPLWWAAVNALVSIAAATVTLQLARSLSGWRLIAIVPALLSTSAAANAAAGCPPGSLSTARSGRSGLRSAESPAVSLRLAWSR